FTTGTYNVTSDCPSAKASGTLTWDGAAFDATAPDFGLPAAAPAKNSSNMWVFADSDRECKAVGFSDKIDSNLVFVCHNLQTSDLECTISLTFAAAYVPATTQ